MVKYKDINEWVAPLINKMFALKDQIKRIHETIVLDAWHSAESRKRL